MINVAKYKYCPRNEAQPEKVYVPEVYVLLKGKATYFNDVAF